MSLPRKLYPTVQQKTALVEILEGDRELRQGKFSATFTKKESEKRWDNLASNLNSIPGAKKTWMEWRKTWQDMKSKSKKQQATVRRQQYATGGGPPPPPLSPTTTNVLATISGAALIGHTDSQESVVTFLDFATKPAPGAAPAAAAAGEIVEEYNIVKNEFEIHSYAATEPVAAPASKVTGLKEDFATKPAPGAAPAAAAAGESEIVEEYNIVNNEFEIHSYAATEPVAAPASKVSGLKGGKENQKKKPKLVAQRRLQKSLETAEALRTGIEEKNCYKKIFYTKYILEMQKQTQALEKQSQALVEIASHLKEAKNNKQ